MAILDVRTVPDDGKPWAVLVDDDDYDRLARFRWRFAKVPNPVPTRTVWRAGGATSTTLGREVMGLLPGDPRSVRRIDTRGLDFRRTNLRIVLPTRWALHIPDEELEYAEAGVNAPVRANPSAKSSNARRQDDSLT
jgi:hypothetical protein